MNPLGQMAMPSLVRTLTLRLVVATMALMVLQAGIVAVRDYFNETDFLNNYVRREAQRLARLVVGQPRDAGVLAASLPARYGGRNAAAYAFRVVEADGRIIAERNAEMLSPLSPWTDRPSLRQDFWVRKLDSPERMHVAGGLKIRRDQRDIWVELATFGDPENTFLGNIAQDILDDVWVPMLPLVLLTILVAATSVRSSLRPMMRAASRADEISVIERGERLDVTELPAEASHFASAINRLLDRVADLVAANRLFIARAAHELRTPLSIMMLELAHLKDENAKRLEADVRSMSEIVDQLLALSRLETIGKPRMVAVDVSTIVRELVARMHEWAEKDGHKLSFTSHRETTALGDEATLRDAVRNLLENAIKHTPPGTEIRVSVGGEATVVVEDSGPGLGSLSPEQMQLPFRKGSTRGSGAGLGLAIVRQTVELHGGRFDIGRS